MDSAIDLGPEDRDGGGRVVAEGLPENIATAEGNYAGKFQASPIAACIAQADRERRALRRTLTAK